MQKWLDASLRTIAGSLSVGATSYNTSKESKTTHALHPLILASLKRYLARYLPYQAEPPPLSLRPAAMIGTSTSVISYDDDDNGHHYNANATRCDCWITTIINNAAVDPPPLAQRQQQRYHYHHGTKQPWTTTSQSVGTWA